MFTIVISEKGGTERREAFDREEISVGRVQGNDLMLPKGNVSKHHARLLSRDGRFIVTDLKSTNGTYVNGRKISQATIVREGDKIYVGDFVLRLESSSEPARSDGAPERSSSTTLEPPSSASSGSSISSVSPSSSSRMPVAQALSPGAGTPRLSEGSAAQQNVSHYPLERDPDSESAPELRGMAIPALPGPPRLPHAVEVRAKPSTPGERSPQPRATIVSSSNITTSRQTAPVGRGLLKEGPLQAARRLALITLLDRVADEIDVSQVAEVDVVDTVVVRVEQVVHEQATAMRVEGEAPEGVDIEQVSRDAVRELVELGPIGPLLDDALVSEIHVARPDHVVAMRNGQAFLAEPGFASDQAVARTVARLAAQSGERIGAGESVVARRLAHGARMVAIGPPLTSGWTVTVRKRRRIESTLDELVRTSALPRAAATFLEACVAGRMNILVVRSGARSIDPVTAALVAAMPAGERVAVLHGDDDIVATHLQVVALGYPEGRAFEEASLFDAARFGFDRLVAPSLGGPAAAAVMDAIASGADGLIASLVAPSIRQGLGRLAAQIAFGRPGTSTGIGHEAIAESFEVVVEVRVGGDGRAHVLRIAELDGAAARGAVTKDIFAPSPEAADDPSLAAVNAAPRVTGELAARGIKLEAGLFKRGR